MAELEHELRTLRAAIDWPPTPGLELRLQPARQAPTRRRRPLFVALAVLLLAAAVALSVPSARSAILRVLHLGGVTIERVDTLPAAQQRPLAADLGVRVDARRAHRALGAPMRLPKLDRPPQLYQRGLGVSTLLAGPDGKPVLLTEFRSGGPIFKKLLSGSTTTESVQVATFYGIWIAGQPHLYVPFAVPPRLAGNVLLWQVGAITFRLEGRHLRKADALDLGAQIMGT